MFKKLLLGVAAFALLGLTACGSDDTESPDGVENAGDAVEDASDALDDALGDK